MKKTAGAIGIILAIVFLILGFTSTTPDKYIKSYGEGKMYEYVGGDAYNYIIEASLRGGEIAGAKTARAVYFAVAGILFVLSVAFLQSGDGDSAQSREINAVYKPLGHTEPDAEPADPETQADMVFHDYVYDRPEDPVDDGEETLPEENPADEISAPEEEEATTEE